MRKVKFLGIFYISLGYTIVLIPIVCILAEHFFMDVIGAFLFFAATMLTVKPIERYLRGCPRKVIPVE
jgi:type IV secretory pathway VirB3-like protein